MTLKYSLVFLIPRVRIYICQACQKCDFISCVRIVSSHSDFSTMTFSTDRKAKDTLPLFRQFFSSAFSLTYVSLASMKLPPDVLRCFTFLFTFSSVLLSKLCTKHMYDISLASSPCLFSLTSLSPQSSSHRVNIQSSYQ